MNYLVIILKLSKDAEACHYLSKIIAGISLNISYIPMPPQNALSCETSNTRARRNMMTFRAINFVNPLSAGVNASI